jgi:hypothetical protein
MKYLVLALIPAMLLAQPWSGDTIGGTTYDWQANGSCWRMIANDPAVGIHATWMFSASPNAWPDRNMRYNFYDNASSTWMFNQGATFMDYGVNAFSPRTGYGNLDVNPVTGCAYIGGHQGSINPHVAKDAAPGTGVFEDCDGTSGADQYLWAPFSISGDEKVHISLLDNATRTLLFYSRIDPWCTWAAPIDIADNDPTFPDQFIAASRASSKVLITWVLTGSPSSFYYRLSTDGGNNWDAEVLLDPPPAFTPGSETTASMHLSGNSIMWDRDDNFHITVSVMPYVGGSGYIIPAEIWDYCPARTEPWSKIARAVCKDSNLMAPVGYNALYATRPMLAQDPDDGGLACVWEQFDSMNVETVTGLLRADIFAAGSTDGGATWSAPRQLTIPDNTSHRFPSVAQRIDSDIHIVYEQDLEAGMYVQGEGNMTNNPMVYLDIEADSIIPPSAVGERPSTGLLRSRLSVSPNPFSRSTNVSYELNRPGAASLRIYDVSGNLVKTLASGNLPAGRGIVAWSGRNDRDLPVARGIYVARLETPNGNCAQKVVFSR